jgi:hypothetical protein
MQQQFHGSDQTKMRPAFRILGTLVFSILAVVFAADIVQLLTANSISNSKMKLKVQQ